MAENREAAQVFMMARNQCLTLNNQIMDISIPAVKIVMDLYKIKNQLGCLMKVMRAFSFFNMRQGNGSD